MRVTNGRQVFTCKVYARGPEVFVDACLLEISKECAGKQFPFPESNLRYNLDNLNTLTENIQIDHEEVILSNPTSNTIPLGSQANLLSVHESNSAKLVTLLVAAFLTFKTIELTQFIGHAIR